MRNVLPPQKHINYSKKHSFCKTAVYTNVYTKYNGNIKIRMVRMAYQALYRKLRPIKFSEVFGQDEIVKTLKNQIKNNQIAHAYLFCGTRGTGKTSLAKILANAVNCLQQVDSEPCGECAVCKALQSESSMDIIEMDAASRNGVDDMRELLEKVAYPPQMGKYKVYIIDEVHMLSTSAFNALLKTLEEPPEHIIFILATTESQKIPATILSRCQRYDLSRVSSQLIFKKMQAALQKLNIAFEDEALKEVAIAADGSVRDGWSILDICISGMDEGETLSLQRVQQMLGTSKKDFLFTCSLAIIESNYAKVMALIMQLMQDGKEALVFLRQLSQHFRNILLVKISDENIDERISSEEYAKLKEQAQWIDPARLIQIIDVLMAAEMKLKWSTSPRIGLENTLMQAATPFTQLSDRYDTLDAVRAISDRVELLAQNAPAVAITAQNEVVTQEIQKVEQEKPREVFAQENETKKIWSLVLRDLKGAVRLALSGASLQFENGVYYITYDDKALATYKAMCDSKDFQESFSNCVAKIIGKDVKLGIRKLEKDNSTRDMMIQKNIAALKQSLPAGTLIIEE